MPCGGGKSPPAGSASPAAPISGTAVSGLAALWSEMSMQPILAISAPENVLFSGVRLFFGV